MWIVNIKKKKKKFQVLKIVWSAIRIGYISPYFIFSIFSIFPTLRKILLYLKWPLRRNHHPHVVLTLLAHLAKGNMSFCHHLASVVRRLSSVNFSQFNLLLWYPSAKWTETWLEASMECPLISFPDILVSRSTNYLPCR